MRRILPLLIALGALLGAAGCSGAAGHLGPRFPAPAERQSRVRSLRPRAPPVLIAPPPAYGNKIVLARGEAVTLTD